MTPLSERVSAVLTELEVPHALIGATALAAAGVVRSTIDVDFLTMDRRVLDPDVWTALTADDGFVDVRHGDADDPLAGVVRISAPGDRPVDLIVGRFAWQQRAIERARRLPSGVAVVLPRDLVLLKLYAGGVQDLWDIEQLRNAVRDAQFDRDVEAELDDLPSGAWDLWRSLRRGS